MMPLDLPVLSTAYPGLHPWVDLRDCLVNGWEALGPQTCGVSAQPNMLAWSMRLIGDNSTSRTFMADLPVNLRPPQNLPVGIFISVGSTYCLLYRSGTMFVPNAALDALGGSWDRSGEMTVTGLVPRGTAVM